MGDYSKTKKSLSKLIVDNGKAKISLPKLIKDCIKARIGLLDTIIDSKYVLLVPKGIFLKYLYIIL
jgi:hypothetical protein